MLRPLVAVLTVLASSAVAASASGTPHSTVLRAALTARESQPHPGDRAGERGIRRHVRTRLPGRLPERDPAPKGELLQNFYAIGHVSLDNYIAQVSGQAPTQDTQADCADNGFAFVNVTPGTPDADQSVNPGQVDGEGCVYPASVPTIASQLDAKYPPNTTSHVAAWRAYEQDMGNTPSRDGGSPDPTGGTDCGHPAIGAPDTAEVATPPTSTRLGTTRSCGSTR